jgi:serine/threonine protein phosphatase 1
MYKKLNIESGKVFIIGDLHGCYDLLMTKLLEVSFDANKDTVISVGDLIDRGEQNIECLELLKQSWFHCVRGNHEDMAIKRADKDWQRNGGTWYFQLKGSDKDYCDSLLELASKLPYIIELNYKGKKIVVCHADYPYDNYVYNDDVSPYSLLWCRIRYTNASYGFKQHIEGADSFYFGHSPVDTVLQSGNIYYIDTGAVFCGELTLIEID